MTTIYCKLKTYKHDLAALEWRVWFAKSWQGLLVGRIEHDRTGGYNAQTFSNFQGKHPAVVNKTPALLALIVKRLQKQREWGLEHFLFQKHLEHGIGRNSCLPGIYNRLLQLLATNTPYLQERRCHENHGLGNCEAPKATLQERHQAIDVLRQNSGWERKARNAFLTESHPDKKRTKMDQFAKNLAKCQVRKKQASRPVGSSHTSIHEGCAIYRNHICSNCFPCSRPTFKRTGSRLPLIYPWNEICRLAGGKFGSCIGLVFLLYLSRLPPLRSLGNLHVNV